MIPALRDLSYEERLKECGLTTLGTRRLRVHQIDGFKTLNGYENIDRNILFLIKKDSRTRGYDITLINSFSHRTITEWNKCNCKQREYV